MYGTPGERNNEVSLTVLRCGWTAMQVARGSPVAAMVKEINAVQGVVNEYIRFHKN